MIAGCVQPAGNETGTPGATPTPTLAAETPVFTTPGQAETPMTTPVETPVETPIETPVETPMTTPVGNETPAATPAGVTETPPGPPAAVVADELISITDGGFSPSSVTVPSGTTVGWTNDASTNQTVTATGTMGFFDSGLLAPGDSFTYPFTATGNYTYTSQTSGFAGEIIVTVNTS
ncbi:hypothetical protein F8E02_05670 [Methanoculleus sp. Wushi-C6]|uniref:Plastocyanin n=2 Tax=Methanoculleus caldifontis TaxID=2651577 RepID=A0ABU3X0M2_9EURY|nr:hypothetical protein [Methanoculleus sp. Wushi-C6]